MRFKSYLLMFIASFLMFTSSLSATPVNKDTYKKNVTNYIQQLNQIQNQIFTLARGITFPDTESQEDFVLGINIIRNNLDTVRQSMDYYFNTLPTGTVEKRYFLILFNAVNLIQGSLSGLSELNDTNSSVEKMTILEDYFSFRVEAIDSLDLVEKFIATT